MKVERIYRINKVLSTVNEYSKVENLPYKYQLLFMNNDKMMYNCSSNKTLNNNGINLINSSINVDCFLYDKYLQLYNISHIQPTFDVYC